MKKLAILSPAAFVPAIASAAAPAATPLSTALTSITNTFDVATVASSIGTIAAAMASVFVVVWGAKRVLGFFRG